MIKEFLAQLTVEFGISLLQACGILALAWYGAKFVQMSFVRYTKSQSYDPIIINLIAMIIRYIIFGFGCLSALSTLGINMQSVITGVGLTGFGLTFAFKDSLSNLIAGVSIMLYLPFKAGDTIKIDDFHGKVINIDTRHTTLKGENETILLPNSKLFTDAITIMDK